MTAIISAILAIATKKVVMGDNCNNYLFSSDCYDLCLSDALSSLLSSFHRTTSITTILQ